MTCLTPKVAPLYNIVEGPATHFFIYLSFELLQQGVHDDHKITRDL